MQGLWVKTAASGFRMTAGTPSGRYGLPFGNRDSLRPNRPPPASASLRAGVAGCGDPGGPPPHFAPRVEEPGGRKIEPQPFPCSSMGWP